MKKIILFGAGQIGYSALRFFGDDVVECFVDNSSHKHGKLFYEKKVLSFKDFLKTYNEEKHEVIVSCLAYEIISAQLTEAGISSFKEFKRPIVYDYVTEIKKCVPKELVSSDKLDVAIKYLYAKDIISAVKDTPNKSLYARTLLTTTGCSEENFDKTKEGLNQHFEVFENLCKSMQEEDFKPERYIPAAKDKSMHDGGHRLATALALNREVYVGIAGEHSCLDSSTYNFEWFEENGFSFEDKIRIMRGFADLYDECGIFVLFSPIQEQWNFIQAQIKNEFKVVGYADINLSHNFIAFEILIREIYGDYCDEGGISDKISLLKMSPLTVRIILISNEKKNLEINEFYDSITRLKLKMRDCLKYDLATD